MKVRSVSELNDRLSRSLAWRKRELSTLHTQISAERREHQKRVLRRTVVPILYSHWEGFLREAGRAYLEFVSRQRLRYEELETCFVSLACKKALRESARSSRPHIQAQLIDFLRYNLGDRARVPFVDVLELRANASSEVLRDVLFTLGLPYDEKWSSKALLLDGSLLKNRNGVAHGQKINVDQKTYEQLKELVVLLLDQLKDCIENAAITEAFRSSSG